MHIQTLARRMAEFRIVYAPKLAVQQGELRDVEKLSEYYLWLLRLDQVIPLFYNLTKKKSRIIALAEFWLINEEDVQRIKNHQPPAIFSGGSICYVANVTVARGFEHWPIFKFYRTALKLKLPDIETAAWYDLKKQEYIMRRVIRCKL